MQIEAPTRHHRVTTGVAKIRNKKQTTKIPTTGEEVEQLDFSYTAGGKNAKPYSYFQKQLVSFL